MSFGYSASLRFDHNGTAGGRKPLVFWEQQAVVKSQKTDKKFKYVGKEQKFNLRNTRQPEIPPEEMPSQRKAPASRRSNNQDTRPSTKAASHPSNRDINSKPPSGAPRTKKPTPKTADTVVLTQKQFDDILETIGNLTIEAEDAKLALSQTKDEIHAEADSLQRSANVDKTRSSEIDVEAVARELPPDTARTTLTEQTKGRPPPGPSSTVVEPVSVPGLGGSPDKPTDSLRKSVLGVPTAHLTKAERKRLEWERERAESAKQESWSPWGKPGAGAPIKDNQGNVVSDYNKRQRVKFEDSPKEHEKPPVAEQAAAPVTVVTGTAAPYGRSAMNATAPASVAPTTNKAEPPPAAMRSSFAIEDSAPDEGRFMSAKERKRQEWLQELEKQKQEQQQRKLAEKDKWKHDEVSDTWAQRFAAPSKPAPLPEQQTHAPVTQSTENLHTTVRETGLTADSQYARVSSAPLAANSPREAPANNLSPRTNIRGQNVHIDDVTLHQLEDKRKKHEEHQAYIRQQIEEKERLKRLEKEKRVREEQEEEEKLRKERDHLQNQLQKEKNRQKEKQDEERLRLDALKHAMEEAQERAGREKHEKRMRKLQEAGHDVSHLHATFEAKTTPRYAETTVAVQAEPLYGPGLLSTPRGVIKVEPSHIPGLDPSPRAEYALVQQDRVLTPTKHRYTPASDPNLSIRRESASQTDLYDVTRESTGIEYNGPFLDKKKKVRVKSASKEDKMDYSMRSRSAPAEPQIVEVPRKRKVKLSERPKWGTKQPEKKGPVKQSEKDPFYHRKQKEREYKRVQRQEQMHKMATAHAPRASESTTVASRARSRSNERRESLGAHQTRSRSPPDHRIRSPGDHGKPVYQGQGHPVQQAYQGHQSRADSHSRQQTNHSHSPYGNASPHNKPPSRNASPGHHLRSSSPPIPAIKHRRASDYNPDSYTAHQRDNRSRTDQQPNRGKYNDHAPVDPPVNNGEFVPFIRSSNVLDPAHAESPLPVSREPSSMDRARKAYVQEHDPAKFGYIMDNFKDDIRKDVGPQMPVKSNRPADPIMNPALVTEHPSGRQSRILQQLSDLRRGLMQKQRELEIGLPGMEQALLAE